MLAAVVNDGLGALEANAFELAGDGRGICAVDVDGASTGHGNGLQKSEHKNEGCAPGAKRKPGHDEASVHRVDETEHSVITEIAEIPRTNGPV
jgi:hypothetical protein